jgi:hypothetical protein
LKDDSLCEKTRNRVQDGYIKTLGRSPENELAIFHLSLWASNSIFFFKPHMFHEWRQYYYI